MKLPLLLLALSGLLLWSSYSLGGMNSSPPIVSAVHRQAAAASPSSLSVRAAEGVDTSVPPLFRAVTIPAALAAPQPGNAFAVVGLAGVGGARVALLRDEADHRVFSVRGGDTVRDWTVSEADDHCVTLRKARQRQHICLS